MLVSVLRRLYYTIVELVGWVVKAVLLTLTAFWVFLRMFQNWGKR